MLHQHQGPIRPPSTPMAVTPRTQRHRRPRWGLAQGQLQAEQSAPPSLAAWATENGLTGATIKTLEDKGCNTVGIITSLLESDVQEMGLNIGQRRMLLKAIQAAARSNQPSAPPGVGLPQTLLPAAPSLGSHGLPDPLQVLVTPGANDNGDAGLPLVDLLSQGQGRQDGSININKSSQLSVCVFEMLRCSCISLLKRVRLNTKISLTLFWEILPRKQRACSGEQ